jgi:hypothetical protein
LLESINERFRDIVVTGRIEQGSTLPAERDEPELAALPRLIFSFDRRSLGKLRQLIDAINLGRVA